MRRGNAVSPEEEPKPDLAVICGVKGRWRRRRRPRPCQRTCPRREASNGVLGVDGGLVSAEISTSKPAAAILRQADAGRTVRFGGSRFPALRARLAE